MDDEQAHAPGVPAPVERDPAHGSRGGARPVADGQRPLSQHQHQRGSPGGARGDQEVPRHLLHRFFQPRLRRGVDRRGQPPAMCRAAAHLPRRRPRPRRAPAGLLGSGRPAQALPRRGRLGIQELTMLTGLDHIVIAVPELAPAQKSYETLGFTVVPGGRHPVGTHNALIAFADGSYIELIAFYEKNTAHKWWEPLQRGGGLVDFCMQTDDLAGDTAAFRRAGVAIDDPSPLSRLRPDGYQLKWVLSIPRGDHKGVAPFLIQDETPRDERVPRQARHANGVTGIGTVTVAVADTARVRGWYEDALGRPGQPIVRGDLAG